MRLHVLLVVVLIVQFFVRAELKPDFTIVLWLKKPPLDSVCRLEHGDKANWRKGPSKFGSLAKASRKGTSPKGASIRIPTNKDSN